ncbi:hypothetical protein GCM10008910_08200 [Faecalicatena orotica]
MQSANLTAEYEFTAFFGYVIMLALGEVFSSLVRHIPKYLTRYFTSLVFMVQWVQAFNQKGKITHADAF